MHKKVGRRAAWCLAACAGILMAGPGFAGPRTVQFARSVFRMEQGVPWAHISSGANCQTELEQLHWTQNGSEIPTGRFGQTFHQALVDVGAAPQDDNLFAEGAPADLQVAAALSDMRANICEQNGLTGFRGSLSMTVQWQVFDPATRQIIGRFETHATGQTAQVTANGLDALFLAAFRENARDLMSDSGFQKVLRQPAQAVPQQQASATDPLQFAPAGKDVPKSPPQAVQAVVLVQTSEGHGSGFLISPEGYILTNHHVVGSDRSVRVRWADGTDGIAQVLRSDRRRDVALIRATPPPGQALALHLALPGQGEQVFAIGAPLDPGLQGTLTRGIVSANRLMDGRPFIQSDVAITHGNSGGPLLNEHGEVVGIADLVLADGNGTEVAGLGLFIPIADALRALSLSSAPIKSTDDAALLSQRKPASRSTKSK